MLRNLCLAWIVGISCMGMTHTVLDYFSIVWWWIPFIISLIVFATVWYLNRQQQFRGVQLIAKIVAVLSTFALAWQFADQHLMHRLQQEIQHRQHIEGIVYIRQLSEGKLENWRQPAQLLIPQQNRSLKILLYPKRIYDQNGEVTGLSTGQLQLGKFYQVTLDLKPPHGQVNAGGFDQEKWLLQQDIQGTASVLFSQEITATQVQSMGWYQFVVDQQTLLTRWRLWIEQLRLDYRQALLKASEPEDTVIDQNRALLLGLLTGDRSGISTDTTLLYQYMGISHLLAISGPHVLILATMLSWLIMQCVHMAMRRGYLSRLYEYIPRQKLYLPLFLGIVTFYVAFTGFEIPALRTWVIAFICSVCLWCRLAISSLSMLLLAAVVVLIWDCSAILSAAFWLSFVASAMLLMIYQQLQKQEKQIEQSYFDRIRPFFSLLWQSQWRIFIVLIPIVLWQFKAVSLISPLINLLAIPFLSLLIVPLDIMAACIWQVFPALGQALWWFASGLLSIFNSFLMIFKPLAEWLYLSSFLTGVGLISLSFAIFIACLPKGLIPGYWAILFLIPVLFQSQQPQLQIDVLDVGQGQAIALQTKNHQMLIDTGAAGWQSDQASMGDKVILPFLRHQGIRQLDEVLLSHLDLDHSGGAAAVMTQVEVKQLRANVFDSNLTDYPQVPFVQCHRGQIWQWDQVDIEILSPDISMPRTDQNESSCVVLISTKMFDRTFKVLIMGDAGWESEYQILQRYPDLEVDVLVLGHHGSKYSSAYDFLAHLNPKLAIISAGKDNRYGHPTPETLARLQDLNIVSTNTADLGAIHLELESEKHVWRWHYQRLTRKWLLPQ